MITFIESEMNENKRQRKRKTLSLEQILRKSFDENVTDYINNCSLVGIKQMCDSELNIFLRVLWTAVFCTSMLTVTYFLLYIWSNTLNKPLIVTMATSTYPIGQIAFPAVAICSANRISKKAAAQFALENYSDLAHNNESMKEVEWLTLQWGRLIDYSYNDSLRKYPVYLAMSEMYRSDTQKVISTMKQLAPQCRDILVRCAWASEVVECSRLFNVRRTSHGHCCTFNFIADYNNELKSDKSLTAIKRQNEAGFWYGLNVILDPMIEDYGYSLNLIQGFNVFIYDASHFPDSRAGRVIHRIAEIGQATFFEIHSTKQVATREVRKYSTKTRKCLFHDESKFMNIYSYSACIVNCRILTLQSLCKCTPYFISQFRKTNSPICTLDDLRCLHKYKEKILYVYPFGVEDQEGLEMEVQESLYCPDCLPDCELTRHYTNSFEIKIGTDTPEKDYIDDFLTDINLTGKSFVSVYHPVPDSTLDRLDIVNYWFEILSNIGGFAGMIMGFTFISVVEIVYYTFIRYFQLIYVNYTKYN